MVRVAKKALSEGWVGRFLTTNLSTVGPFSVRSSLQVFIFSSFFLLNTHTPELLWY